MKIKRRDFNRLMLASVAGMLVGCQTSPSSGGDAHAAEKHACKGMNSCKGQGACKSGDNGCAGKNSCKGHGRVGIHI